MGPPNRPLVDKPVDVNELGDVMAASGVDLKEQEALLLGSRAGQQGGSFGSIPSSSFNSVYSTSVPGYFDRHDYGHNVVSQNVPADRSNFYGSGTLSQEAITPESFEDQALAAEKRAIRRRNEIKQYHLNDPFLQSEVLFKKVNKCCDKSGLKIERPSAIGPTDDQASSKPMEINIYGPDQNPRLAVLKGRSLIAKIPDNPGSSLSEIYTLLSLSSKDRIRVLLEDSATFAKGRRTTSGGVVPPEFVDMATGLGKAEEVIIKATSSATSLKRMHILLV